MKYKVLNKKSYNLHIVKTSKFKTLFFKIIFSNNIKKEDISSKSLILDNLIYSSKKYPSKRKMNIQKQELYGSYTNGYIDRIGKNLMTVLEFSVLSDKYTEEGNIEKSFKFLNEILFNPNVKNGKFNEEYFDLIKNENIKYINRIVENPKKYSSIRLKENMEMFAPFSYRLDGYVEDIEKSNNEYIYKMYKKMLKEDKIDIFVVGNYSFKKIEKLVGKYFDFKDNKNIYKDYKYSYENTKRSINNVVEKSNNTQSNLFIGCNLENLTQFERNYSGLLFNIIFGNSPESKLFKNVREKDSLAYSINSYYDKTDSILSVYAGISYENYEKSLEKIKYELKQMKEGNFEEIEIENAKKTIYSVLNNINSSADLIADYYYNLYLSKNLSISKTKKLISKVSKKDIVSFANKIDIDTIFLLKEKKHDKESN